MLALRTASSISAPCEEATSCTPGCDVPSIRARHSAARWSREKSRTEEAAATSSFRRNYLPYRRRGGGKMSSRGEIALGKNDLLLAPRLQLQNFVF